MEQELQKLNQRLTDVSGLHAEIDYGVDYDLPGADTIIVVDDVTGEIIAEGETADGIITELNFKLRRKKIKVMSAYEYMTADQQVAAVIASWDEDWLTKVKVSKAKKELQMKRDWDFVINDFDSYLRECTDYYWSADEYNEEYGIEAFNRQHDTEGIFVGGIRYDKNDADDAIFESEHRNAPMRNAFGVIITICDLMTALNAARIYE